MRSTSATTGAVFVLALFLGTFLGAACGDIEVAEGGGATDTGGGTTGRDVAGIERRVVYDPTNCDPHFAAAVGGRWNTYDDRDDGGDSRSVLEALNGGTAAGCAMRWVGALSTVIDEGYAGIELEAPDPFGLNEWRVLVFTVRGDGAELRVDLPREDQWAAAQDPDAAVDHWNFHGAKFACGNGTDAYVPVVIDLARLAQEEGWGEPWPRDNGRVKRMRLHPENSAPFDWQCDFGKIELRRGDQ